MSEMTIAARRSLTQNRADGESAIRRQIESLFTESTVAIKERKTRMMSALRSLVNSTVEPKFFIEELRNCLDYKFMKGSTTDKIEMRKWGFIFASDFGLI